MRKFLLYILMACLNLVPMMAQTEGYDPSNPPDPTVPGGTEETVKYQLSVTSSPLGSGSLNTSGGAYAEGTSVYLYAYDNSYNHFQYWIDDNGEVISQSRSFNYTMPGRNARVSAVYKYEPANPADPEVIPDTKKYPLTLVSVPQVAGSFSPNGTVELAEGESTHIYAYTNQYFRFLYWTNEAGDTISYASNFYYTMPAAETRLYAHYEYVPGTPPNPGKNAFDEMTGEVIADDFTPGSLNSAISDASGGNRDRVTSIIVAGVINSNDFSIANSYSNCTQVDLSRTTGVSSVPGWCYSSNTVLTQIALPASITSIGSYAFNGASSLAAVTCHAITPPSVGTNAFNGVAENMIVYVPEKSIELYEAAEGWKDFIILPIQADVHSLELNLPAACADGRYKHLPLELINIKSGQKYKYVVTDRINYIFSNLIKNTVYNAYLKNLSGVVLAEIDSIKISESDLSLTFENPLTIHNVNAEVYLPNGQNVTTATDIAWFDKEDVLLGKDRVLSAMVSGQQIRLTAALPQSLGMQYVLPSDTVYTVGDGSNRVVITLQPLPEMQIQGKVVDQQTQEPIALATVTVSQMLNGKYAKSFTVQTDKQGNYTVSAFAAPTKVNFAENEHVSRQIELTDSMLQLPSVSLADVALKAISGATVNLNFTYTPSVKAGAQPEVREMFEDYNNVSYTIHNLTQQKDIAQFSVQYPKIVLLEEVNEGDCLQITAISKNGSFMDVKAETAIDEMLQASVTFPIVQLGGIESSFTRTENTAVTAVLYDAEGSLVKTYNYEEGTLNINNLKDGKYTLVSMGKSNFFNSVYSLNALTEVGLTEGTDYVKNAVEVKSGRIAVVKNVLVPFFDESKLYYTDDNTAFTVNKNSIVAGNYLTMQAKVDFKDVYRANVSNVSLVVDLPEGCVFVENSLMIGSSQSAYEVEGHKLIIPYTGSYTDKVRFCIIPEAGGKYAPNAYVRFQLDGQAVMQPIGNVNFEAKNLSIDVPGFISKPTFVVKGTAAGRSRVQVFADNQLIGETTSLANGFWSATCDLGSPYNMSLHTISAKVQTPSGLNLESEAKECCYNLNRTEMKNVVMTFYNGWMRQNLDIVWNFENMTTSADSYSFYTSTDFSFVAELTNNDTTLVSGVTLVVETSNGEKRDVITTYNPKLNRWVGTSFFNSNNLPINLSAVIYADNKVLMDRGFVDLKTELYTEKKQDLVSTLDSLTNMEDSADAILSSIDGNSEERQEELARIESLTDENERAEALAAYFNKLGITSDASDFKGEEATDIDQAYVDEMVERINALLAEESETVDYEAIEKSIQQADLYLGSAVQEMDYNSLLNAAVSDTTTFVNDKGEQVRVYKTDFEHFGPLPEGVTDTLSLAMTDSSRLYVFMLNEGALIVDSISKNVWAIESASLAETQRMLRAKDKGGFVETMNRIKEEASELVASIQTFIMELVNEQNDIKKGLMAEIDGLKADQAILIGNSAGKKMRISDIEKELYNLRNTGNYMGAVEKDALIKKLNAERDLLFKDIEKNSRAIEKLEGKLGKFTPKLFAVTTVLGQLNDFKEVVSGLIKTIRYIDASIKDHRHWYSLIDHILPCENDYTKAVALKKKCEDDWTDIAWRQGYYPAFTLTGLVTAVNGYLLFSKGPGLILSVLTSVITTYVDNTATNLFNRANATSHRLYPIRYKEYHELKCKTKDPKIPEPPIPDPFPGDSDGNGNGGNGGGSFKPINPIHDPSGYVYEAVESNRLPGVMATVYYKETVEDMYGDLHENIVLWDAEEYAQKNPLFTDENGMYAWDVPQGLWQVKFEKEGYQTAYSEWLPVPPPQLEVNIGMVQNAQPEVVKANAYEDGVEVEFSKYMNLETLNNGNIYLKTITGTEESYLKDVTIEPIANEAEAKTDADETIYAAKVMVKSSQDLGLADEVYLIVNNRVQSYAGIPMAETFTQQLDVEKKVRSIVADETLNIGYDQSTSVQIGALPVEASKGKTLAVKTGGMIASVSADNSTTDDEGNVLITLDENGQASIRVNGDVLGTTGLTYRVIDTDVRATSIVNVVDPAKLNMVKEALASRISGTSVYRGQTVSLSCESEGATIYYTLDGSCPCDAGRIKYEGKPIAINNDLTLKVMAVGLNGSESEVKEYVYTIRQTNLQISLAEGWNWTSHNKAADMSESDFMGDYVKRLLTQQAEMINDLNLGFVGNIGDIAATQALKVQTDASANIPLAGEQYNPNAAPIYLHRGWNWIGYPMDQTMSLAEAFAYLDAETGDILTNLEGGYAEYTDDGWVGNLEIMTPGKGYLYKSASEKTFVYNDDIVSKAKALYRPRLETVKAPWTVNAHGYPNMMCLTARLFDNGSELDANGYLVGAFAGNECRGIGKGIAGTVFLPVYGDIETPVCFIAFDKETGLAYTIAETVGFVPDAVGSVAVPFALNLGEVTDIAIPTVDWRQTRKGIYNIAGQKVNDLSQPGVYIVNGKKVIINK